MSVKGLAHVAIQARDYQATIAFYTEVLGFKRGHHWSLPSFRIQEASMLISPDQRTCLEIFDNDAVIPRRKGKGCIRAGHCSWGFITPRILRRQCG